MKITLQILMALLMVSCQSNAQKDNKQTENKTYAVVKTDVEWRAGLSEISYYVLRQAGTERAFSGPLNKNYDSGTYHCAGCGKPLYRSENKYDSKSGWPSFDQGIDANLEYDVDYKLGYARTELKCNNCGGHLGHMFEDGPRNTTGKRHCINSAALTFVAANEKE